MCSMMLRLYCLLDYIEYIVSFPNQRIHRKRLSIDTDIVFSKKCQLLYCHFRF